MKQLARFIWPFRNRVDLVATGVILGPLAYLMVRDWRQEQARLGRQLREQLPEITPVVIGAVLVSQRWPRGLILAITSGAMYGGLSSDQRWYRQYSISEGAYECAAFCAFLWACSRLGFQLLSTGGKLISWLRHASKQ